MKTKTIIFLAVLISAAILASSFTKQASGTKYATMRTVEAAFGWPSKIVLAYDGKTEELELGKASNSNMTPNALLINQAINLMASKGYELVSQSGDEVITMYTFVKR